MKKPVSTFCHYCGNKIEKDRITLDHKHPRALGGTKNKNNVLWACNSCNILKNDMPYDDFILFAHEGEGRSNIEKRRLQRFRARYCNYYKKNKVKSLT